MSVTVGVCVLKVQYVRINKKFIHSFIKDKIKSYYRQNMKAVLKMLCIEVKIYLVMLAC